jgi:phosphatidylglycerophosphate synthase
MPTIINSIKNVVRTIVRSIASALNKVVPGIDPNVITMLGLIAHIPIALLIADNQLLLASILLIVFGLFDTLDGELARLQNRESLSGRLLDSITDRMKEVFIYAGIAYYFLATQSPKLALIALLASGAALIISYINAWGEAVLSEKISKERKNKLLRTGLMTFEIRITTIIIGLLINRLAIIIIVLSILSWFTLLQRLLNVLGIARTYDKN